MIVSIERVSSGKCVWCCQPTDEGVVAEFHDGLKGFFCKKDLWAALKARATSQSTSPETKAPPTRSSNTL